jgi:hypothetical protein
MAGSMATDRDRVDGRRHEQVTVIVHDRESIAPTTPGPLSKPHTEWLTLIRYQTRQADDQSRQPPPLATLAINGLQDAVEAMLSLVCEHHSIAYRNTEFLVVFDAVIKEFPPWRTIAPR